MQKQRFSQLFLLGLLHLEKGSLGKHCKDHPDQLVGGSEDSLLRSQSFSLPLEEIGLKERILAHY
jgi:hypothetical protein